MRGFIKDMTITIIVAAIIVIFGTVLLIVAQDNVSIKNKELVTDTYILEYDSTWKLRSNDDDSVRLKHKNGSIIDISIDNLPETYKYSNLSSTIDNVLYSIEKENKELSEYRKLYEDLKQEFDDLKRIIDEKIAIEKKENERTIIREKASELVYEKLADEQSKKVFENTQGEHRKRLNKNHHYHFFDYYWNYECKYVFFFCSDGVFRHGKYDSVQCNCRCPVGVLWHLQSSDGTCGDNSDNFGSTGRDWFYWPGNPDFNSFCRNFLSPTYKKNQDLFSINSFVSLLTIRTKSHEF